MSMANHIYWHSKDVCHRVAAARRLDGQLPPSSGRGGESGAVCHSWSERGYGGGRLPSETSGTQGLSRDGFGLWFLPTQSQPPVADIASICLQIKSAQVHRPLILCPGVTYPPVLSRGPRRTCSCAFCPFHSWKSQGMAHSTQQPHGAHAPSAQHHL